MHPSQPTLQAMVDVALCACELGGCMQTRCCLYRLVPRRNKATLIVEMDTLLYDWLRPKIYQAITAPLAKDGEAAAANDAASKRWLYVILVRARRCELLPACMYCVHARRARVQTVYCVHVCARASVFPGLHHAAPSHLPA